MRFILFAPYGAPANLVMAHLKLDARAARNLMLNNRALRWGAICARMRCRGYGRRSHEQQCADYRDVSEGKHRMLPFAQAGIIIAPVTVFSKQATAKFKSRHPDIATRKEKIRRWLDTGRSPLPMCGGSCVTAAAVGVATSKARIDLISIYRHRHHRLATLAQAYRL